MATVNSAFLPCPVAECPVVIEIPMRSEADRIDGRDPLKLVVTLHADFTPAEEHLAQHATVLA